MDDRNPHRRGCAALSTRLAALLDGELSLPERRELEAHLRTCPRCAAELEQERAARSVLRDAAARMEAPAYLRSRVESSLARAAVRRSAWRRLLPFTGLAAAIAILAIAGFLVIAIRQMPSQELLRRVATAHHQETLSAAPVSFSSSDEAAVDAWLEQQNGEQVDIPSLEAAGYRLLGARLDPSIAPHAVTIVYDSANGRLTCVILPAAQPSWLKVPLEALHPSVHAASTAGAGLASWAEPDGMYVMAADLQPAAVATLAQIATARGSS
jgi:mycothiol system anti-sigma-R factor